MKSLAIERNDAGCLLAAMLKRVQAERRDGGGVRMTENAEDATLLAQAVGVGIERFMRQRHRSRLSIVTARLLSVASVVPTAGRDCCRAYHPQASVSSASLRWCSRGHPATSTSAIVPCFAARLSTWRCAPIPVGCGRAPAM